MNITGENATTLKHQSTIEAITSIEQSLKNSKEPTKKLRHSLKNLCFFSPEQKFIDPLCGILLSEMIEETKCFKLACFHLISHAHYAHTTPKVPKVLEKISQVLTSKKITDQAAFLYRVLFFLGSRLDTHIDLVINTTISLLSTPASEITKVQKKGIFGKETVSPFEPLIHEVISLLVDLPKFEKTSQMVLSADGIPKKLLELYKMSPLIYKQRILHFLGRLNNIPDVLNKIGTKEDFSSLITLQFLSKHRDCYPEVETAIFSQVNSDSYAFYLYLLAQDKLSDHKIMEKIMTMKGESFSVFLSWLSVKSWSPERSFANVAQRLYVATTNNNPTIALTALKILISPETDQDWFQSSLKSILDRFNATMKRRSFGSFANMLSVMCKVDAQEEFERNYLPIVSIVFRNYIDMVTEAPFENFMRNIAEKRLSRQFFGMAVQLLSEVPAVDTVIYIFYGAALLENYSEPEIFEAFKGRAEKYLQSADPSLKTVYNTLILKQ